MKPPQWQGMFSSVVAENGELCQLPSFIWGQATGVSWKVVGYSPQEIKSHMQWVEYFPVHLSSFILLKDLKPGWFILFKCHKYRPYQREGNVVSSF